ncbi:MAG: EAL domain-containing protein [Magnetospirillum sp.]|nr:EAL domain-containing protein [Magnetospirillum sp.]
MRGGGGAVVESSWDGLTAKVFDLSPEAMLVVDANLAVQSVNPAFCRLTGQTVAGSVGGPPPVPEDDADPARTIWEAARADGGWRGTMWARRGDGSRYAVAVAISRVDGGFLAVLSDITVLKTDEERIRRQATTDHLTGLPNRSLFLDRLGQAVFQSARHGQMVGLMFVDLDGFKLVNDTLGHDLGDQLLLETGRRLALCVRHDDTVARLGGDEFTVLMPNLGSYQNAPTVAQRILDSLRRPFDLAGREAFISASIGITVYPDDAGDAATMLQNADAAMYRAKEQGKANFQFFTPDMHAAVEERLAIKNGLSKAFERDELMLWFQPKLDLASRTISGVEALLRWQAADLGMVSPSRFIPVMEETGLIGRVGEWAIAAACRQHRAWRDQGLPPLRVAVNLSVRQLRQPGFVDAVERILAATGCPPAGLEFEITEGMVIKDSANAIAILKRLNGMGIGLAMDDFGTGYSSLSVLKRFPVDAIKIDGSFIADIETSADDATIVRTIISMGHSLGRRIVAEGVETLGQATALAAAGCDEIQGYLLSPPVPADAIPRLMRTGAIFPPGACG